MGRSVAVALLLLLSVGCSEGPGRATSRASTSSAAPTASSSALDIAGAAYLAAIRPTNVAYQALVDALKAEDLEGVRATAADYAAASRALATRLGEIAWPDEVQATVDELLVASAEEVAAITELSRAQSPDDVQGALDHVDASGRTELSRKLRRELGLPPPPKGPSSET